MNDATVFTVMADNNPYTTFVVKISEHALEYKDDEVYTDGDVFTYVRRTIFDFDEHHVVRSQLNGNNGEWTNTDDIKGKAPVFANVKAQGNGDNYAVMCARKDKCIKEEHYHLKPKKDPLKGAKRRLAEKVILCKTSDLVKCPNGVECYAVIKGTDHYHTNNNKGESKKAPGNKIPEQVDSRIPVPQNILQGVQGRDRNREVLNAIAEQLADDHDRNLGNLDAEREIRDETDDEYADMPHMSFDEPLDVEQLDNIREMERRLNELAITDEERERNSIADHGIIYTLNRNIEFMRAISEIQDRRRAAMVPVDDIIGNAMIANDGIMAGALPVDNNLNIIPAQAEDIVAPVVPIRDVVAPIIDNNRPVDNLPPEDPVGDDIPDGVVDNQDGAYDDVNVRHHHAPIIGDKEPPWISILPEKKVRIYVHHVARDKLYKNFWSVLSEFFGDDKERIFGYIYDQQLNALPEDEDSIALSHRKLGTRTWLGFAASVVTFGQFRKDKYHLARRQTYENWKNYYTGFYDAIVDIDFCEYIMQEFKGGILTTDGGFVQWAPGRISLLAGLYREGVLRKLENLHVLAHSINYVMNKLFELASNIQMQNSAKSKTAGKATNVINAGIGAALTDMGKTVLR